LNSRSGSQEPTVQDKIFLQKILKTSNVKRLLHVGLGYQRTELDDAKFEAVTLEQVNAVAQKYLKPDAFVVSVVKP
jgi:predicted Zn-dependent peptidase